MLAGARVSFAIDANLPPVTHRLDRLARTQVPFASALALTRTAEDARKRIIGHLPQRFVIRSAFLEKGIRIRKASKRRLQAHVFSRDPFMRDQEYGGTRTGGRDGLLEMPRRERKSKSDLLKRSRHPAAKLKKAGHFLAPVSKPPGAMGVYRRVRKGPPVLLWVLDPRPAKIRPVWGFRQDVADTVARNFDRNFGQALGRAIATAR